MTAQAQATQTFPTHGEVIVFSTVPAGSYCTPGVRYQVERTVDRKTKQPKGPFTFRSVERGSATIDAAWAVRMAAFEVVA